MIIHKKRIFATIVLFTLSMIINHTTVKISTEEGVAGIAPVLDKVKTTDCWTTENVNFRKGQGIDAEIICTIKKGTKVKKHFEYNGWTMITYDNQLGYVNSKYLRDTELPLIKFTDKEIEILQRITEAECTGKSKESKANVTSIVLNRVYSSEFPDDIESVVFQQSQFTPIADKRYYKVEVTQETIDAVNDVIKNGVKHDCLYFCNYDNITSSSLRKWFNNLEYVFTDSANHSFYREVTTY